MDSSNVKVHTAKETVFFTKSDNSLKQWVDVDLYIRVAHRPEHNHQEQRAEGINTGCNL